MRRGAEISVSNADIFLYDGGIFYTIEVRFNRRYKKKEGRNHV